MALPGWTTREGNTVSRSATRRVLRAVPVQGVKGGYGNGYLDGTRAGFAGYAEGYAQGVPDGLRPPGGRRG